MTDEDQELLAKIGHLAGQINRHKSQQASRNQSQQPSSYRHAPYQPRGGYHSSRGGYRGRHPPTASYRNRTLQLNSSTPGDASANSSNALGDKTGWVSRSDRHLQLINSNIYESQARGRVKAMEKTRQEQAQTRRTREKLRIQRFLANQPNTAAVQNEITVEGIRFRVADGGKKLVKAPDELKSPAVIPRTVFVAGVKFNRTKNGNLVANRIVKSQRHFGGVKKVDELCKTFCSTGNFHHDLNHLCAGTQHCDNQRGCMFEILLTPQTGSCPKGPSCRYTHNPHKVALCKDILKDGRCRSGEACDLSHDMTPERVPNCLHFAKGNCTKADCPYTHSKASPSSPVCRSFGFCGYCEKGADCEERHVFECPDFSNTGKCRIKGCRLPHRERASILRNLSSARDDSGEAQEQDVSSDDESADSDDVDSDEVAEFITADSDESDWEEQKVFIRV